MISLPFGRCPTMGRTGSSPYPRVDEIVREARRINIDLQLSLLRYLFAMPLQCSPLETYCHWSFPDFRGASQSSPEFPSLLRSSPVFAGAPPCLLEFLLVRQSSSLSAGVPATSLEPLSLRVLWRFFVRLPLSSESFPVVSYDAAIAS